MHANKVKDVSDVTIEMGECCEFNASFLVSTHQVRFGWPNDVGEELPNFCWLEMTETNDDVVLDNERRTDDNLKKTDQSLGHNHKNGN